MMKNLKILFVEDCVQDFILVVRLLSKAGLQFEHLQISSLSSLQECLYQQKWDLVITDYHLPGFTAVDVLTRVKDFAKQQSVDLPVIVISGAIQEENAADLLRFGAKDFVRKDNHVRLVPAILREIADLEQRNSRHLIEEALIESQGLTKQIFQNIEDCILVLDRHGQMISANESAARILDLETDTHAMSRPFADFWTRIENDKKISSVLERAFTGEIEKFVGLLKQSSNLEQWWHVIVSPLASPSGKVDKLLIVARDLTDERLRQEELRSALNQAESANKMKSTFLANMSHEIRTPVGVMMGFADLMSAENLQPEEKADYLKVIHRNGETLLRILNEILDLSKIEAGHLEIVKKDFSLINTIKETVSSLKLAAEAKNIRLDLKIDEKVPSALHSDPVRLQQILANLVGNAIKFTEQGEVSIHVSAEEDHIVFRVRDSGLGISVEDQAKLFKPFSQSDSSISRKFGGTGLGLMLAKRFANALGGDVKIESSQLGQGSCFKATVANDSGGDSKLPRKTEAVPTQASSLDGYRILVAEDVQDNQDLLRHLLRNSGARLDFVSSGKEAVDFALSNDLEFILMDIQMPGMDGMTAMRELRSKGFSKPIIALSAHAMKDYIDECLNSGFDGYISKPIDSKSFVKSVTDIILN
jgi:PAS domain S-box-containing protein